MALLVCPPPPSQRPYLNKVRFTVGLLVAYTTAMFVLYTVAPLLYRMASSAYYNISLLTSDFYGLLFGLFLFVCAATYFSPEYMLTICVGTALLTLLALLPVVCCGTCGVGRILLACHT